MSNTAKYWEMATVDQVTRPWTTLYDSRFGLYQVSKGDAGVEAVCQERLFIVSKIAGENRYVLGKSWWRDESQNVSDTKNRDIYKEEYRT